MDADALLAQLLSQRRRWVALGDGVEVQIETPSLISAARLHRATRGDAGDDLTAAASIHLRDWRGVTTATVLGSAVGCADEPAPWSPRVWAILAGDRPEWISTTVRALLDAAAAEAARHQATEGN